MTKFEVFWQQKWPPNLSKFYEWVLSGDNQTGLLVDGFIIVQQLDVVAL